MHHIHSPALHLTLNSDMNRSVKVIRGYMFRTGILAIVWYD
jgi:hypothetical protein